MSDNGDKGWRAHKVDIGLGVSALLLLVFVSTYHCDSACADWDYIDEMLFVEFRPDSEDKVWRWSTPPTVFAMYATQTEAAMVRSAVLELNALLADTPMEINFRPGGHGGDIGVAFVSRGELEAGLSESEHTELPGIRGFWLLDQGGEGKMEAVTIVVIRNQPDGSKWGTVLHELGHALGLVGHTDRYLSSLFFANIKGGSLSDGFSSDDRKLLRFLYSHLRPGADRDDARRAFDQHWIVRSP